MAHISISLTAGGPDRAAAACGGGEGSIDQAAAGSPTKIAFISGRDGNFEIYVMSGDGSNQTRLTANLDGDFRPDWSPDGAKIAFVPVRDGNAEIYVINADGTGVTRLTNRPNFDIAPDW